MKTEWDLTLLYKSDTDPQIEKDIVTIEKACAAFEKKYRPKPGKPADFIKTPKKLAQAFAESEKMAEKVGASKPLFYLHLKKDIEAGNNIVSALGTKYGERLTEAANKLAFFELEIAKIPKEVQKKFLNARDLASYRYDLEHTFKEAKYHLSEGEEQLSGLLSQTSYDMWLGMREKILSEQTVEFRDEMIPMSKASSIVADLSKVERRELHQKLNSVRKSLAEISERELNAIFNYKKIMDKRRGFAHPYSATILGYENDEKAIEKFVALVTKYFTISQKFYALQAKLLKEKKITYADRNAKIGEIKTKFSFEKSSEIFRKVLVDFNPEFALIFDSFLKNSQIDVYPKKGKQGGAYCAGSGLLPTFVLLNDTSDIRSAETLAHEMGHAIHTELSKAQPPRYRGYSIAVAETASTLFEQMMSEVMEEYLSDDEKIVMLHARISGDVSTIFRQVALFNFEVELHTKIRTEGEVSKEIIAGLLATHMRSYLGPAVEVTDDDGYAFVDWSHIRSFFYVYTYAYGQLISRALFEKWKQDKSYAKKIEQFLSAGSSMSPENIFKSIGIDTSKTEFFEAGLKSIERDIERLEKMTKGRK